MILRWFGLQDFEEMLKRQMDAWESVLQGNRPVILACEHPSTITLGKRSQAFEDLLVSFETLREKKIKIVGTDRGGHATIHNPGQLVIYPILPLRGWSLGVRAYVECLERASAYFFAEHGIEVDRGYDPGLWVDGRKIAAFGIRVSQGVSLHGAALNICNDLSQHELVRQCSQRVEATNLEVEMKKFVDNPGPWNLEALAKLWTKLFLSEIGAVDERFSFTLDEQTHSPLEIGPSL